MKVSVKSVGVGRSTWVVLILITQPMLGTCSQYEGTFMGQRPSTGAQGAFREGVGVGFARHEERVRGPRFLSLEKQRYKTVEWLGIMKSR